LVRTGFSIPRTKGFDRKPINANAGRRNPLNRIELRCLLIFSRQIPAWLWAAGLSRKPGSHQCGHGMIGTLLIAFAGDPLTILVLMAT
jgi:hypothetical protein